MGRFGTNPGNPRTYPSTEDACCAMGAISLGGLSVVAVITAPIWLTAAGLFLKAHPTSPASAFWAVVQAIAFQEDFIKAGAKERLKNAAIELIAQWVKKYMAFLPDPKSKA